MSSFNAAPIARGLQSVHERVVEAAKACGRDPSSIRLVAVSKRQPVEAIRAAYSLGQRDFGENYVQEWLDKQAALVDLPDLRWHLIGHLQTNKVRAVVAAAVEAAARTEAGKQEVILHAVDRIALVDALTSRWMTACNAHGLVHQRLSVLLQVHLPGGGDDAKEGVSLAELPALMTAVEASPALALQGLMTVAPLISGVSPADMQAAAAHAFAELAALRLQHDPQLPRRRLPELSMGMTGDLEQAIAAGATIVRVGTAIFGARH